MICTHSGPVCGHRPKFLKDALTFLVDAVGHAVNAVQIVTLTELFDKFR